MKNKSLLSLAAAPALALSLLAGTATAGGSATITQTAIAAGRFDTLVAALEAADLADTLDSPGTFTVFAPTDRAFKDLPAGTVDNLLLPENQDLLTSILLYHVAGTEIGSGMVTMSEYVETLNGQRAYITLQGGQVFIDDALVQFTDILCTNGVIHVIDTVLMPETRSILELAATNSFRYLVQLAKDADLDDELSGPGDFTVFAPTDAAFEALGQATIDFLRDPANQDTLIDILLYHAVGERLYADEVVTNASLSMLNGDMTDITVNMNGVFIDDAQIVLTDIQASNGVIHVIDAVIQP
jgi:uncharacterized surface protein with fasciclin (FAS1) repeats